MRKQRLRAMMASANGYIVHVQDARDVMRVDAAHVEADHAMVRRGVGGPDDAHEFQLGKAPHAKRHKRPLPRLPHRPRRSPNR